MRKILKIIKHNVFGFIAGAVIFGSLGVYAASVIAASNVDYSDNNGLGADNVQDAIDKLNLKTDIRKRNNFISAYTYNSSTCVTGEEDACIKTDCYKTKTARSCPSGTIIKYKVNDTDIVTFHVMYDNGSTLIMQSQKNIINNTMWISNTDYETENTDKTSCGYYSCNDEGPMTVLVALERATNSWTNINDQNYTMGTTSFKTNAFTGCNEYNSCTTNTYTLPSRTVKARMITVQEAVNLGCTKANKSCPNWMNNYLCDSISYSGTISDNSKDVVTQSDNCGYWSMNTVSSGSNDAWIVNYTGSIGSPNVYNTSRGARAVVVVSK